MKEREGLITFKGDPLTLVGNPVEVGDKAPDFKVVNTDMEPKTLEDYKGKTIVLNSVPSLDTPVCDAQARRFNKEAGKMSSDVEVLFISMDLPFAQKRWCGAAGADNVTTLSDHKDATFGLNYGLLIKQLRLLARTVMIINKEGKIEYIQLVKEVAEEPDYEDALDKLASLV